MTIKFATTALAASLLMIGCAGQKTNPDPASSSTASSSANTPASGTRVVKSKNGNFDGEIVGTPAAGSKFAKVQIGMTMGEVSGLIGAPDDIIRHETGKRWIPFYFGNDAQRMQTLYKGEGCLTYTAGNVFGGGGNELIRVAVDPKGTCFNE